MDKDGRTTVLAWLGFKQQFDFNKSKLLGSFLGWVISALGILLILVGVFGLVLLFMAMLGIGPFGGEQSGAAIRNLGLLVAAVIGTPFLVWRTIVAQKNANVAEQSQITDRLNNAVSGLGAERVAKQIVETPRYKKGEDGKWLMEDDKPVPAKRPDGQPIVDRQQFELSVPNIEVRIGALLSLERIARDSPRDHIHIMEILCAYLRENSRVTAPASTAQSGLPATREEEHSVREDIQIATNLILRRSAASRAMEASASPVFVPDLRAAKLDGVNARQTVVGPVLLDGSTWVKADLGFANFDKAMAINGCDFSGADLDTASFNKAHLSGVTFSNGTLLGGTSFVGAHLNNISFSRTQIGNPNFEDAVLSNCYFSGEILIDASFKNAWVTECRFDRCGFFEVNFLETKNWEQEYFDRALGIRSGPGTSALPDGAKYPEHWIDMAGLPEKYDPWATFEHIYQLWNRAQLLGEDFDTSHIMFNE